MASITPRRSFVRAGRIGLLLSLALSLLTVPSLHAAGSPTPQWGTVFQQALAGTEGYAYIVAQNGQVVTSGASGLARSANEAQHSSVPWTTNTRMNMASVSKTVTATAVMSLVQQGKVSLTAPFLPYIQSLITNPVGAGIKTVTISDLLQMKSGMVVDNPRNYAGTLTQYLNTYLQQALIGTPGVTYAYSDANFDILQVVIDQIAPTLTPTYTDYTDYVTRAILLPMGINTTLFSTTPDPQATATLSYSGASDLRTGQYWAYTANVLGSGGWVAPVSELLKFAIGVRNNVVLTAANTTMMFTQLLGWYANNGMYGTYYQHNGGLTNSLNPGQGLNTGMVHFSNGYDAVLYVNSPDGTIIQQMIQAFEATSSPPTTGLQFYPLAKPVRLLDTRIGSTAFVTPNKALTAGQTLSLPGQFSANGVTIPPAATAIVGNATVANGSNGIPAGFATIFPSGVPLPLTSNLNFVPGTVRPNAFTVALGSDTKFNLYSSSGGDFVVDISGYYAPVGAGGLYFHPLSAPVRELDTRSGATAFMHPSATLTAGQTLNLPGSFAFSGITVPAGAKALVGNATVANSANATPAGFATLYPNGVPLPLASNLNFVPGTVAPNAFTVGVGGDGTYNLYSSSGGDFIIDITGYLDTTAAGGLLFTPLSAPVRELDTRSGATAFVHPNATMTAGQTLNLAGSYVFTGITVPTGVKALVGNATVANDGNGTAAGFATLYPNGVPLPLTSNLNFVSKQVAPNAIVVGVGGDGTYNLYSSSGGDFIIDITGYFS